jgi:hypothetical protein
LLVHRLSPAAGVSSFCEIMRQVSDLFQQWSLQALM